MPDAEVWDVTDEHGKSTGLVFRRGDPDWPAGRFHLIVSVCAVRPDGRMLVTQRAASKEFGMSWEFPGGSALAGETSREAAARELKEETGLAVRTPELQPVGRFTEASAILDMYVARVPQAAVLTLDPSEVRDTEWRTPEQVQRLLASGGMAAPWTARLAHLWPAIARAAQGLP